MDLLNLGRKAKRSWDIESGTIREHLITSPCIYHHYLCDGIDDRGWGCGYRTLQCLCSWAVGQRRENMEELRVGDGEKKEKEVGIGTTKEAEQGEKKWKVPSLREIQETLVEMEDKPAQFIGSREWIGSIEACLVLDHLYSVVCKIVHVPSGAEVMEHIDMLTRHFDSIGSPVMIGGDVDGSSKTLIGVMVDQRDIRMTRFLIADPHYVIASNEENRDEMMTHEDAILQSERGLNWHRLDIFQENSFYNFCLPQSLTTH